MSTITVFVVDDHELMRIGLREALDPEPDIIVTGEAERVEGTSQRIATMDPDVALLDVRLPDGTGVELCRDVLGANPSVRCIMFTSATGDEPLHESVLAGAAGYVLKDAPRSELVAAIRKVAAGASLIDPAMTGRLLARIRERRNSPAENLTDQERRILELIAEGLTNKEIAERLYLADQTVKNYVSHVLTKLGMSRTRAAVYAAGLLKGSTE
jgi:two-component system, NarL family, response regulator DevR